MIERSLGHISDMLGGQISDQKFSNIEVKGVSIDSRTIEKNNLYIPIIGEKFDGRLFIKESQDAGACAFLIDKNYKLSSGINLPYIIVEDTKKALQDLASAYRQELNIKIVAITGSNGKTTTKNIIHSVLKTKYRVEKTQGNLNNEIGLPRTVLNFNEDTEIGILEMGTDNFGDISTLTNIGKPDLAIITNIGDSHLLNLKTKEGIAKAKLEILEALNPNGSFIYNGDDEILKKVVPNYDIKQKIITFGKNGDVDFRVKSIEETNNHIVFSHQGEVYQLPLLGSHQTYNGACAVLIGKSFGLSYEDISQGLLNTRREANRNELISCCGFDILNDAYKSNPQSLRQGLETTKNLSCYVRKIAVLGDMLELGENEKQIHYDIGKSINPKEIESVLFYGNLSKYMYKAALENFTKDKIYHFENKNDLIDKLKSIIIKSTLVFVKGSRSMHMEEVIEGIEDLKV